MSAARTVIITGGAGGLGRAMTRALQADGWRVVLIDLPGPELDAAAHESDSGATAYACDLTDAAQVDAVCARIRHDHASIGMVIYNAGITQIGPFSELGMDVHRKVFEVNYFGAVRIASAFLEPLRESRGIHLAISSVAGFAPLYQRAAYSASKHALEGFFKTLRAEERPFGVDVLIAAPSFVATNIGKPDARPGGIARPGSAPDGIDYMDADEAARIILAAIRRRRAMIPVGRIARMAWLVNRLSPALYAALMRRRMAAPRPPKS